MYVLLHFFISLPFSVFVILYDISKLFLLSWLIFLAGGGCGLCTRGSLLLIWPAWHLLLLLLLIWHRFRGDHKDMTRCLCSVELQKPPNTLTETLSLIQDKFVKLFDLSSWTIVISYSVRLPQTGIRPDWIPWGGRRWGGQWWLRGGRGWGWYGILARVPAQARQILRSQIQPCLWRGEILPFLSQMRI